MRRSLLLAALISSTEAFHGPLLATRAPACRSIHQQRFCTDNIARSMRPVTPHKPLATPSTRLRPLSAIATPAPAGKKTSSVYGLILVTFLVFLLDNVLRIPFMRSLYLYHSH